MFHASTALSRILAASLASSGFGPDPTLAAAVAQDAEECLLTDTGAPLKVVGRRPTATYADADEKSASQPVQAMAFFYAMPTADNSKEKTKSGFYRIARSPRKAACVGWIKADDVVEWPHRQVGGLRLTADRDRLLFFATLEDLQNFYADAKGSKVRPISREPDNLQKAVFLPDSRCGDREGGWRRCVRLPCGVPSQEFRFRVWLGTIRRRFRARQPQRYHDDRFAAELHARRVFRDRHDGQHASYRFRVESHM